MILMILMLNVTMFVTISIFPGANCSPSPVPFCCFQYGGGWDRAFVALTCPYFATLLCYHVTRHMSSTSPNFT